MSRADLRETCVDCEAFVTEAFYGRVAGWRVSKIKIVKEIYARMSAGGSWDCSGKEVPYVGTVSVSSKIEFQKYKKVACMEKRYQNDRWR